MTRLHGFAIITGAASGLAQATAIALVAAGVSGIALLDVNAAGLETTHSLLLSKCPNPSRPPAIRTYICDVTSAEAIEKTYTTVHAEFGRIDFALHCAGTIKFIPTTELSPADFDLQNTVNYRGLWLCQRAAIILMRKQTLNNEAYPDANIPEHRAQRGAIVNIASSVAITPMYTAPAYSASKAGVLNVTKADAVGYAPDRIRINAVLPGIMDTPMTNPNPELRQALTEAVIPKVPLGRFGKPEEVADVMVFLCSSDASYVTGAGLVIDGGLIAG